MFIEMNTDQEIDFCPFVVIKVHARAKLKLKTGGKSLKL